MKRRWGLLAAALLAAWLGGCAQTAPKEEAQSEPAYQTVYGKIKAINGNEMVLAVMETAAAPGRDRQQGERGEEEPDEASVPSRGRQPEGTSGAGQRGSRPAAPGGDAARREGLDGATDQGGDGGMPQGGQTPTFGQPDAQGGSPYRLTGEERTYLIPATATVTTGQGEDAQTLRFTQLTYKNVVLLSLDEEGAIVKVQVLE